MIEKAILFFIVLKNYTYNFIRNIRYSGILHSNFSSLEAEIISHCHVIEKGMSFKKIRWGYGEAVILNLIKLIEIFKDKYSNQNNDFSINMACSVLNKYLNVNEESGFNIGSLEIKIKKFLKDNDYNYDFGGRDYFTKESYLSGTKNDYQVFCKSRKSLRNFDDRNYIDLEIIKKAIDLARYSPSSCNRQPSRVYIIEEKDKLKNILELQGGNRGFGEYADKLLILTVDTSVYTGPYQENLAYIDGGIFGMSLLNSLHYFEIGACSLHWAVSPKKDNKLRAITKIKRCENVIFLIAIGCIPTEFCVAKSKRKDVEYIINK